MIDTKVSEVYEQTIKLEELEAEPEQAPAHNNKQTNKQWIFSDTSPQQ